MESIDIPEGITSIYWDTFWGCSNLTSLTLPKSLSFLGARSLYNCTGLKVLTVKSTVPPVLEDIYTLQTLYNDDCQLIVPANSIENYKVADEWMNFKTILGFKEGTDNGVDYQMIENQTAVLTGTGEVELKGSVSIPETISNDGTTYTVTKIDNGAYQDCNGITSVKLPATISEIGSNAFAGCSEIESVTCLSKTPPTIFQNTFDGVNKDAVSRAATVCTLYVYTESIEAYKSAPYWNEFINIVGIEATGIETLKSTSNVHEEQPYNLLGQPVSEGYKGIVIRNGKKMLVK